MNTLFTQTTPAPVAQRVCHTRVRPGVSKNVIYSTYQHVIELYGSQMPVLVAESLNYTPGAKESASVNINPDIAWAWYVYGRRLLVWHIPSFTDTTLPVIAREMVLPASDLAHHAHLIYIFPGPNKQSPSCIAVSPEGVVRYWVILGHHSTWVDVDANLGGEEVCAIHHIPPLGCLAVTTSGSLVLVSPSLVDDTPIVNITRVTPSYGWLNSIGKTVSSLIFGEHPQKPDMPSVKALTCLRIESHWHIFLLAGFTLQSWTIEVENSCPALIYETNIEQIVRKAFPRLVREDLENEIQITDIKHSEADSIIALAASNDPRYYVIVELDGNDTIPPTYAIRMAVLARSNINFLENVSGDLSSLCFVLLPTTALVFSKFIIYAVPLSGGEEIEGEPLDLPGGIVLGGIMYKRTPIFFSATFGFVTITPVNTSSIDVLNTSVSETSCVPSTVTEREPVISTTMDDIAHLKVAFVHFVRRNYKQCIKVIYEEFPFSRGVYPIDSVLATTLVKVSLDIINDFSPIEQRWKGLKKDDDTPGINYLQMDTQLTEKLKAHDLFLHFGRKLAGVVELGDVSKIGGTVKTIHVLYEHNEKIATAFVLKKLQKRFEKTVKDAVVDVACEMKYNYIRDISSADFFYRYTSLSDKALKRIINICLENIGDDYYSLRHRHLLKETNIVINTVLSSLIKRRESTGYYMDTSYIPWLSASPGLFDDITALVKLNFNIIKAWGSQNFKLRFILAQFFLFSNNLLFLRMPHIPKKEFDSLTSSFIQFFIDKRMIYEAMRLAYKYKNFDYLISLTYQVHRDRDIINYIKLFGDEGFCQSVFEYLESVGNYKAIIDLQLSDQHESLLRHYISDKPVLKWIYCLKKNKFAEANEILLSLKDEDKISVKDQEIICIFSQLICHAGELPENPDIIALQKRICIHNEIPEKILLRKGYDPETIKVLDHKELIEFYSEGNKGESFLMKALEVIDLITDPVVKETERLKLWIKTISLDTWEGYGLEFTSDMCDHFVTFRLMKLLKAEGDNCDISSFNVPTINEILSSQLLEEDETIENLRNNLQCIYVYQYWYDQIIGSDKPFLVNGLSKPESFQFDTNDIEDGFAEFE